MLSWSANCRVAIVLTKPHAAEPERACIENKKCTLGSPAAHSHPHTSTHLSFPP